MAAEPELRSAALLLAHASGRSGESVLLFASTDGSSLGDQPRATPQDVAAMIEALPETGPDDDDVRDVVGGAHELSRAGDVRQRRRPRVRGEADRRHADPPDLLHGDLPRAPRMEEPDAVERRDRLVEPFLAGVLAEEDGSTSATFTSLLIRAFVRGTPSVPSLGMGRLPELIAAGIPAGIVQLNRPVVAVGLEQA